ncbi:Androgen-induced 1 protein, partial [Ophiophagus hannah]
MPLAVRGQRAVALLHFLCFLWATFALTQNLGLPKPVRKVHDNSYGGQWKYLTFLNQTLLYLLCVTIDAVALFVPSQEKKVSSIFVAVAFWGLYAIDRELVYPKELDDINPDWLNHTMHTTILPLLFIELVICSHKYPPRWKGILGLGIFSADNLDTSCSRDLGLSSFRSAWPTWKGSISLCRFGHNVHLLFPWGAPNKMVVGTLSAYTFPGFNVFMR